MLAVGSMPFRNRSATLRVRWSRSSWKQVPHPAAGSPPQTTAICDAQFISQELQHGRRIGACQPLGFGHGLDSYYRSRCEKAKARRLPPFGPTPPLDLDPYRRDAITRHLPFATLSGRDQADRPLDQPDPSQRIGGVLGAAVDRDDLLAVGQPRASPRPPGGAGCRRRSRPRSGRHLSTTRVARPRTVSVNQQTGRTEALVE